MGDAADIEPDPEATPAGGAAASGPAGVGTDQDVRATLAISRWRRLVRHHRRVRQLQRFFEHLGQARPAQLQRIYGTLGRVLQGYPDESDLAWERR